MADFPSYGHLTLRESTRTGDDGQQTAAADDGTLRTRVLYSASTWAFELAFAPLTDTQAEALLDHYADHQTSTFGYTWPGDASTYTVRYTARPRLREVRVASGAALWYAQVQLQGAAS